MTPLPENLSGMAPGPKAQAPQTTADAMAGDMYGDPGQPATPEEQAAYERFVAKAVTAMYEPKMSKQIATTLRQAGDPREALGFVTANLVKRLLESAMKQNAQVPMEMILPATTEVYENVAELADAAGVNAVRDDAVFNAGFLNAIDGVRIAMTEMGMLTPEQAQADLQEMKQLEASGGLQKMLGDKKPGAEQPAGFGAAMGGQ